MKHPKVAQKVRIEGNEDNLMVSHLIVLELAEDGVKLDPGLVELVLQHIGPLEACGGHSHDELEPLSSSSTFVTF